MLWEIAVDDMPILGNNRESSVLNQVLAMHGAPAYVRRAKQMEQGWETLVAHWRKRRDAELTMVRTRIAVLRALAGTWSVLRPLVLDDEQVALLQGLDADLRPELQQRLEPTGSGGKLRRALCELVDSVDRFNRHWSALLAGVDLTQVNELRDRYNRFYVLEKECAVRSPRVARQGFQPVAPATTAELAAALPVLPVPQLHDKLFDAEA
jgi:hypothetical protein